MAGRVGQSLPLAWLRQSPEAVSAALSLAGSGCAYKSVTHSRSVSHGLFNY